MTGLYLLGETQAGGKHCSNFIQLQLSLTITRKFAKKKLTGKKNDAHSILHASNYPTVYATQRNACYTTISQAFVVKSDTMSYFSSMRHAVFEPKFPYAIPTTSKILVCVYVCVQPKSNLRSHKKLNTSGSMCVCCNTICKCKQNGIRSFFACELKRLSLLKPLELKRNKKNSWHKIHRQQKLVRRTN